MLVVGRVQNPVRHFRGTDIPSPRTANVLKTVLEAVGLEPQAPKRNSGRINPHCLRNLAVRSAGGRAQ